MKRKGYYKLTRVLSAGLLKQTLILCVVLFILTMVLLLANVNERSFVMAYETLMRMAGIRYMFLGALVMLTTMTAYRIYFDNFKAGGIYTLMMLPLPRRHVFLAYCSVGIISVLMLWTVQVAALMVSYFPVVARCQQEAARFAQIREAVLPFSAARTNGLFLAMVRSDLFHILLPQSWQEGLGSLLVMLAVGVLPVYGILIGGAKRTRASLMFLVTAVILWVLTSRFDIIARGADVTAYVAGVIITGIAVIFMVADGIRRLNRDASLTGW